MTDGIAPSEVKDRQEIFGKNKVEPDPPDTIWELAWDALQAYILKSKGGEKSQIKNEYEGEWERGLVHWRAGINCGTPRWAGQA